SAATMRQDPFAAQLTAAAEQVRAALPGVFRQPHVLAEPLTATEQRILELLQTSTYLQIADTLYVSRNTVKTHLRSIYHKLGATSRSQALQRSADRHLIGDGGCRLAVPRRSSPAFREMPQRGPVHRGLGRDDAGAVARNPDAQRAGADGAHHRRRDGHRLA